MTSELGGCSYALENEIHFKENEKEDLSNRVRNFLQKNNELFTALVSVCFIFYKKKFYIN